MKRRLFTFLSGVSLLLCAAACVLWVRSYRLTDALYHETRRYRPVNERLEDSIVSNPGRVDVRRILRIYNTTADGGSDAQPHSTRRAGIGDFMVITISDLVGPGQDTRVTRGVLEKGDVMLPYLGPIRGQGRTVDLMSEAISDEYAEALLIQSANVSVEFRDVDATDSPSASPAPGNSTSWALTRGRREDPISLAAIFDTPASPPALSRWQRAGFEFDSTRQSVFTHSRQEWHVSFPHWCVALLCSVLPGFRLFALLRRRHRVRTNHCAVCGYDLRATSDRCPECGTVPANVKVKA
ncbi:MAG: hypothetical protein JWL69_3669 [Phycisphaerales bacterium]|nr:hypothetical protein [Phycisphaerales bacterium]